MRPPSAVDGGPFRGARRAEDAAGAAPSPTAAEPSNYSPLAATAARKR
jgi:hypothetical protein